MDKKMEASVVFEGYTRANNCGNSFQHWISLGFRACKPQGKSTDLHIPKP